MNIISTIRCKFYELDIDLHTIIATFEYQKNQDAPAEPRTIQLHMNLDNEVTLLTHYGVTSICTIEHFKNLQEAEKAHSQWLWLYKKMAKELINWRNCRNPEIREAIIFENGEDISSSIADLNPSVGLFNTLMRAGVDTVAKAHSLTEEELRAIRGMTNERERELAQLLSTQGLAPAWASNAQENNENS